MGEQQDISQSILYSGPSSGPLKRGLSLQILKLGSFEEERVEFVARGIPNCIHNSLGTNEE